MPHKYFAEEDDQRFRAIQGLTWLPWVGQRFRARPTNCRLLIAGESHYIGKECKPEDMAKAKRDHMEDPRYTRDVVQECLIDQYWHNRTLDTLPKLLFLTPNIDHARLWGDLSYYNFIQEPMDYSTDPPERPSWEAFVTGWRVFLNIASILQPSHCLFLGVSASNSFNSVMRELGQQHNEVKWTKQVGRTNARFGSAYVDGKSIQMIFIQHPGKYFSWEHWNEYLKVSHPDLMAFMKAEQYDTPPSV